MKSISPSCEPEGGLAGRFRFRLSGQHVLGRCDGADLAAADDFVQLPGPNHKLEDNHLLVEVVVGGRLLATGKQADEPVQRASSPAAAPLAGYPPRRWAAQIT